MSNPTNVSIVIPVYREENNVNILLTAIQKELTITNEAYEIVLVDDGSTDNTWAMIKEAFKKYPTLRAVRLSRNFGKEYALCAGLEIAKGEAVIVMDGDLQHPPHLIPEMVRIWRESNADVVEAVKIYRGKESILGKLGAKLFYGILHMLSGYNLRGASDYKLLNRQVVNAWIKMQERGLFFRGMVSWLGFRHVQIPFQVPKRISGQSRWSIFQLCKLALTGITAFSSLPLHFVTFSGAVFFMFAVVIGVQTLYMKLTGNAVSGFTTVIILLLIIGSLLMISLGIIGLYIARIYEEVKMRPRYIVLETLE